MARIHYEIPDDLHRRAKAAAAMEGISLKEFLIRSLIEATGEHPEPRPNRKLGPPGPRQGRG